ncbi:MAG: 16S rRNA (adenine(1518)-N(6)/adenine(1519)-N(6))-dimethyltransferase RsmA [Flavobacteriales bacterium]|nr:16S rRNA (adenine(1518)-N(6)/adenine(1519)-N(6))-dimethyltransferase RsmA [Flavobacteriales bacterium]
MVRAKKHLGQHFLKEPGIAARIADLALGHDVENWLEIGPGTGILTQFLLERTKALRCVEIDRESEEYLHMHFPQLDVMHADFLKLELSTLYDSDFGVIGNFPYNISSQIVFKILDHRDRIPVFAGMFQLEVAQRLAAIPGTKAYGILSVLTQAYYDLKLVFKVSPGNFNPPPKVQSGVLLATRKADWELACNEVLFADVVKTAFNQRRKTLSNALKKFNIQPNESLQDQIFKLRAEKLSVADFVALTNRIESGS